MKFIKILLHTYQYEENQNNINYNIIQNLKNFENKFTPNKKKYMKVYIKKVINLLIFFKILNINYILL